MKNNIINLIKTNQIIWKFKKNNKIIFFFKKKYIPKYIQQSNNLFSKGTSKYNPFCLIQSTKKKCLKVYKFNRHIIRSNSLKNNFSSLRSITW